MHPRANRLRSRSPALTLKTTAAAVMITWKSWTPPWWVRYDYWEIKDSTCLSALWLLGDQGTRYDGCIMTWGSGTPPWWVHCDLGLGTPPWWVHYDLFEFRDSPMVGALWLLGN
jgi:hypothetical protein